MLFRNLKILAAVVILIAIGFVVERFAIRRETPAPTNQNQEVNFDLSGYIVRNNPGLKPDTWYLVYEAPGSPALTAELVINQDSSCFVEDLERTCPDLTFLNGQPVHVEGIEKDKVITVRELILISDVETSVKLYYYNPAKDKDISGNILCSRQGLEEVSRRLPVSITPIQDAIRLLLQGNLTVSEKNRGITTEYPLPGFELKGANLKNGVLTLEFKDSQNKTVGGSCRVGVLWFQIEATAKQFPAVKEVKFIPEELFQP